MHAAMPRLRSLHHAAVCSKKRGRQARGCSCFAALPNRGSLALGQRRFVLMRDLGAEWRMQLRSGRRQSWAQVSAATSMQNSPALHSQKVAACMGRTPGVDDHCRRGRK